MHPIEYLKYARVSMDKKGDNAKFVFHRKTNRKVATLAAEETIKNLNMKFPGIELKTDIKTLSNWWTYMFQDITYIEISGACNWRGFLTTFKIYYGKYTTKVEYSGPSGSEIMEEFMLLPAKLLLL